MIQNAQAVRRRRLSLILGTSALAWGLGLPSVARAQCAADPTVAYDTTTCTGNDADGIRVTTPGTTLTVASGATVSNNGASAIAVDVPHDLSGYYSYNSINVLGDVSSPDQSAIAVTTGDPQSSYFYSSQQVTLTIGAEGNISGATALSLLQSPNNPNGTVSATIDNSGTLTGTGGTALLGNATTTSYGYTGPLASFSAITNRAGASIVGAIVGPVYRLDNAGSIDGGAAGAVGSGNTFTAVTNEAGGTIRSASDAATILAGSLNVTNAGTIANAGGGAALSGQSLSVTNQAGGQITAAGTAIAAASSVNLVNQGSVTGNVVAGGGGSWIDSTAGTINGSVTLGNGNNALYARYDGTRALVTGINGAIDAGGGTNTERVIFTADTSVTTPIDRNAGFQQLVLAPDAGVTTTLETGFSTDTGILLGGSGTVVNRAAIAVAGPAVSGIDYAYGSSAAFRNEGSITASGLLSYQYGVTLGYRSFDNSGTVTTDGAGVSTFFNSLVNSGTITASNAGVMVFDGVLTNSGTIVSTADTGAYLSGNVGYTGVNSGTIFGATTGVSAGIYLTNSGTIGSAGIGVAVQPYGYLINAAGGVVDGGSGAAVTVAAFNAGVANAGTINGDVRFDGVGTNNNLAYIALAGGTLNGNLALTGDATLVTGLVNDGPGQFAGITGTVTADSASKLRYAIDSDTAATLPAAGVGPFSSVGYQLSDGAALTLTAPATQTRTQTLVLAGNGSVDLDATIVTTGTAALQSSAAIAYPGAPAIADALSITSRGALSVTRTNDNNYYSYYPVGAVALSSSDSFINAGSIAVTDRLGYATPAISGGSSVTNSSQIILDGGVGVSGAAAATNAGIITQASGGATATGVTGVASFTNTGTISVGGSAVQISPPYYSTTTFITNTGTLASTGGAAISTGPYSYGFTQIDNRAGGTISGVDRAVQLNGATLVNAGTITGTVDLGYAGTTSRSYASSTYVAAGGTIAGDLLFGSGTDLLLQTGDALGVSGVIDGGEGTDIYGRSLTATGTVAIDAPNLLNFEDALVQAIGTGTVVTAAATGTFGGNLYAVGDGSVVNAASIAGVLTTSLPYTLSAFYNPTRALFPSDQTLASLTNAGSVAGGVLATVPHFANSGTIGSADLAMSAVSLSAIGPLTFDNSGTILASVPTVPDYYYYYYNFPAVSLSGSNSVAVSNSGTIGDAGLLARTNVDSGTVGAVALANSGRITGSAGQTAVALRISGSGDSGGTVTLDNSGIIANQASANVFGSRTVGAALTSYTDGPVDFAVNNSGMISAAVTQPADGIAESAIALAIFGNGLGTSTIRNAASGAITATGPGTVYAIFAADTALNLINAGTITATGATRSFAIRTLGDYADVIANTGAISGDVRLSDGADTLDNGGTITGAVSLGAGDDSFVQRVGGTVTGIVDGGDGTDSYRVETTGGATTLAAAQIAGFERVTQTGTGTGTYSGSFGVDTIDLAGGTLAVAAGQTLATLGATTITGASGSGNLSILNAGTIAGGITLASGNDIVVNTGAITGPVQFGAGDDIFVEGVGSVAGAGVDGGAGTNLYRVMLAGDRANIGTRTHFQNLAVDGTGTLALGLDQDFQAISLGGTNLALALRGHSVGRITATGTATQLAIDGDVGAVQLGAGDDMLSIGAATLAGRYDGGAGTDALRLTATGAVTLTGTATGFETVDIAGGALTIAGTLGSAGQALAVTGGDKAVTIARGGVLAGIVDLGAGNDRFRLAAGGMLTGTVSGGAGSNAATLDLSGGDLTLRAGMLTNFQRLTTEGAATLTLAGGSFAYDNLAASGNLMVAADAGLAAPVAFGPADNHLVIAGGFTGSVDGGAGTDSIDVSGGTAAAPVAFSSIGNVEAYRMSGGFATVSGTASPGSVVLTGGRLVGLAGSTLTASSFAIGQGATFGSAGTVNGNVAVAGTLSPGASPGTMTVNGNVALASTSVSLFEITPAVSDKLVVNGAVSIASGATLQLAATGTLTPGTSLDLVTATGGVTGSFTTIVKSAALFGFVVQDANRIRLLGEFLNDARYSEPARRGIDYVNNLLVSGQSSAALIAAVPLLLTGSGATNPAAFARLAPQAYAAARQIGVENGITIVDATRGGAFAPTRDTPGLFTSASILGGTRTLEADDARGTARTSTNGYGFLGEIGVAGTGWSLGAFGGYLNDRQTLAGLGARTEATGAVAGVHGRALMHGIGLKATIAYDGARADTRRAVPGGRAVGSYDLHSWIADVSIDATVSLAGGWAARPSIGGTAIRTTRDGVSESGGSAFALTVAGRRDTATFVDGNVTFAGAMTVGSAVARPYLTIGARYQVDGRTPYALAGLGGGGLGLLAAGAARAPVLATVTLGTDIALSSRLALFGAVSGESGDADHRAAARAGLRLAF